jgi:hypothetical protein
MDSLSARSDCTAPSASSQCSAGLPSTMQWGAPAARQQVSRKTTGRPMKRLV